MRTARLILTSILFFAISFAQAQTDLYNSGVLHVTGGTDILFISGGFTNASGSALTNN